MIYLFTNLSFLDYIEWTAVLLSLTFLILLIKEIKWCWPFGIASSLLSIYYFYQINLYSESILYIYYVLIGFYGWYVWNNKDKGELKIKKWPLIKHLPVVLIGFLLSYLLGLFFKTFTDSERSFVDSTTTIFSFIASYMEAHKIFSHWIFWIIINAVTTWLYYDRGSSVYAGLMLVYFGVSLYGFWDWSRKSYAELELT